MRLLAIGLAATVLIAGCASLSRPAADGAATADCVHPDPCEGDWPAGLDGPFALKEVIYVRVPSFDGTELEGWIGMPEMPEGVRVPVTLAVSPYHGACFVRPETLLLAAAPCVASPNHPDWWSESGHAQSVGAYTGTPLESWGVPPLELVRRGFAAAFFSVRGTGNSGGCFELGGLKEQEDQALLVDWLAAQDWANGRVGMGGLSYQAATAWQAAIAGSPALKTIVTTGIVSDWYTWYHTPQGAGWSYQTGPFTVPYTASVSLLPPLGDAVSGELAHGTVDHLPLITERACPGVVSVVTTPTVGVASGDRDQPFWDERRYTDRFDQVSAAVLLAQGFDDTVGHTTQENLVWETVAAPKRQVEGQWGHAFPIGAGVTLDPSWEHNTWQDLVLAWLDWWLKGVGPLPEALGHVDYQDSSNVWHRSNDWPPAEARDEVLYLTEGELRGEPGARARSFLAAPPAVNEFAILDFVKNTNGVAPPFNTWPALCAPASPADPWLTYWSEPLTAPALLAGNPFAYLNISSNLPGGIVSVHVLKVPPDFDCATVGEPNKVAVVAFGAADLRFYQGNFIGADFPVSQPTPVRIDLWDSAETVEAGGRLAAIVSYGETSPAYGKSEQPYFPLVTVHADGGVEASHLVLSLVEGTLGGHAPTINYQPRPFVPAS